MKGLLEHFFSVDLKAGEEVKVVIRRHWLGFVRIAAVVTLIAMMPLSLSILFGQIATWFLPVSVFWAILVALEGIRRWLIWYLDSFVLTNQRIVNIDQKGLFSRSISEAPFRAIQDVRYDINGFFPTLFRYGDVHVRTVAGELSMDGVPEPRVIQDLVMRLQQEAEVGYAALPDRSYLSNA